MPMTPAADIQHLGLRVRQAEDRLSDLREECREQHSALSKRLDLIEVQIEGAAIRGAVKGTVGGGGIIAAIVTIIHYAIQFFGG